MKRFSIPLVLFACCICANQSHAQALKWSSGYPGKGTLKNSVSIKGTIDTTVKYDKAKVWVFGTNGGQKGMPTTYTIDLDGNWGGGENQYATPSNPAVNGKVIIIVEVLTSDTIPLTYILEATGVAVGGGSGS